MDQKYKYLGKNTIIFAISSFGTKVLSFLLVPLYTAVLTTAEYGIADLITTTATLLVFILTLNIASSVLRFTIEQRSSGRSVLSFGFRVLLIGTLFCMMILGLIYYTNWLDWPVYYYAFMTLYFFATALYEMMTNYLRAVDKVKEVAIAGIMSSFLIILCNIFLLLVIKTGIIGYLISIVLGPLFASIYCMIVAGEPITTYILVDCDKDTQKAMLTYCVPLIFNNIALWVNAFLDRYFVTYFCGVSENGIYSVAGKIPTILSTCYSVFASAWTLSAITEFDPEDKDGFFSNTYNIYGALMTMVCSAIVLMNIPLAHFLYSNEFFNAWRYSSILLLSVMFNTLTVFQGSIFTAAKKTKDIAMTTIISAVVNTILNILLIPVIGALGAAIATAFAYFAMFWTRYIASKKFISMKVNIKRDILIYLVLVFQIILEHLNDHFYLGQVGCFLLIIILNKKYLKTIILVFKRKVIDEKFK